MQMIRNMLSSARAGIGTGAGYAGQALAGAGIGGVASYATDGSFFKGAMMGAAGGAGAHAFLAKGGAMRMGESILSASPPGSRRAAFGMRMGAFGLNASSSTMHQRAGLYAGAGLGGMMFGGNRNNHSTGFNAQRGNRI